MDASLQEKIMLKELGEILASCLNGRGFDISWIKTELEAEWVNFCACESMGILQSPSWESVYNFSIDCCLIKAMCRKAVSQLKRNILFSRSK